MAYRSDYDSGFQLIIGIGLAIWIVYSLINNWLYPQPKVSQSYYYCWNTGAPAPHHLGHPVSGDHLCNDSELHNAGISGY